MDADFIDVDDELMPIEIHEIVSIDEMMIGNPTFVALDDIYIEAFAGELLGDPKKGMEFLGLHKSHVTQRSDANRDAMRFVTFNVDARRRNNYESEEYLTEWKTLYDNVPYHKYHAEMTRSAMPYETDESTFESLYIEPDDKAVSIRLASRDDDGLILPDDSVKLPIIDAKWVPADFTSESYVFDTASTAQLPLPESVKPDAALHPDMPAFISALAPKLDDIDVGEDGDLHSLKLNLSKNGILYDDLSQADLDVLAAKLNNIKSKHDPTLVPKHITVSINPLQRRLSKQKQKQSVFSDKFPEFATAVEAYLDRTGAYLTETRMATLNAMFDAYLSSHPQYSLLEGVDSPFQMAMSLIHSTQDINEVSQALKDLRTRLDTQLVQEYFGAVHGRNDTQARDVAAALATLVLKQDNGKDFVRLVETESFSDIHELSKGIDTSMYEGVESFNQVFIETATDGADADDFDELDDADEIGTALGVGRGGGRGMGAPIPADALTAIRSVDHMDTPFRDLVKFADTAGLPWNYQRWLDEAFRDYSFPASRFEALANITSDIAVSVLRAIADATDEKAGLMEIAKMSNTSEAAKLAAAYPAIFQEWSHAQRYALIDGLAFWALDTLDASIAGTLDFKIPNNAFGHYWSHLGPPIEPKAARGVFPYIAQVAKVDVGKLLDHATKHYPERISKLLQYELKAKDKNDKVKQAFMDAMEMHRQNKGKAEMFLNSFIPMYLHMPSTMIEVVPLKKQPIWAQGCCVVPLNSSYEADADFRYKANTDRKKDTYLYTVKAKLADKRWLKAARPVMYTLTPASASTSAPAFTPAVDLSHDIQASASPLPVFDADIVLMDLAQPTHIKEFKDGKFTLFNAHTTELAQRALAAYDRKHFANLSSILNSELERDIIINLIKEVVVMHKTDSLLDIKRRLAASPNMPRDILRYLLAAAIEKVPADKRVETVTRIKDTATAASFYTTEEAQEIINRKREESKVLTLSKIDALDRDDRELVVAAKKLGVVKYADLQAPPPALVGNNATAKADAGEEYRYRGQDADGNGDDDFDDY